MTDLSARLIQQIKLSGPLSLSTYMTLCLHDPKAGYYATRPGLGSDFITAPEISQVFGELLGLWLAHEWQCLGAPDRFSLIEIGPGRGTLMQDALRAGATVPGFRDAAELCLIEASPELRRQQATRLAAHSPRFLQDLEAIPRDKPLLLLANEWLDCLAANQFVQTETGWHERLVGLDDQEQLCFGLSPTPVAGEFTHLGAREGMEVQPGLSLLADTLAELFSQTTGRALFLDYGPAEGAPHDSLRAYRSGQQIHPLSAPGAADLTVDVDFARLTRLAQQAGLQVSGPLSQGHFLQALGAQARLDQLIKAAPEQAETLLLSVQKLVDPKQMGTRFKALCLSSPDLPLPAGF